jgi:hypothetical protein
MPQAAVPQRQLAMPVAQQLTLRSGYHVFPAGFTLTLQRLVLANAVLDGQSPAGVPRLWPFGMYSAPGSSLSMTDVRMLVSDSDLQQQLQFFTNEASGAINVRTVSNREHVCARFWRCSVSA